MKKFGNTVLQILVFFFGWAVFVGIDIPSDNPALWRLGAEVIPLLDILIFTVVFILLNKGTIHIPVRENIGKGTAVGAITGCVWIGFSAGILFSTKTYTINTRSSISTLWIWMLAAFINVVMQELLVHGFIYQLLRERYSILAAVIVTTAMFTLFHGGAFETGVTAVLNVVTMSLFTTALYEAEGTILAPIMSHAVWNITGSSILGIVKLADDYPSLFACKASGSKLHTGGSSMLEGSIVVTAINVMLLSYFTWKCMKKHSDSDHS